MKEIGTRLGLFLFEKGLLEYKYIDCFRYFIEICFSEYLSVIFLVLISIFMDRLEESLIYLAVFVPLRQFLPGYHCSTIIQCNVLSNLLHLLSILSDAVIVTSMCHIITIGVMTVFLIKEKKEKLLSEISEGGIELFGATPPESNTLRTLNYGDVYTSKPFSGSGWRFSNLQFKPASGTGKYLRWSSYVDSGRVGNYNEGYATKYGGSEQGTSVKAGATIWNSEDGLGQIYYTYNPIAGTYYVVANVNP